MGFVHMQISVRQKSNNPHIIQISVMSDYEILRINQEVEIMKTNSHRPVTVSVSSLVLPSKNSCLISSSRFHRNRSKFLYDILLTIKNLVIFIIFRIPNP